ncbi:hypothetical protein GMORB2_1482 [Geosmithia morbida]|uniref:Uncharacterized protein n=1 Tax=Geosmithia morbida TaxID=1094350 RepID=A0A9P4Z2G5_9HYPO|nr:uncharacterized protein GMORB2_1482 [Geosmithia morbida]KAF4126236.1 hypothetical protein GMORB2_1482 [Geosmithia morbida]
MDFIKNAVSGGSGSKDESKDTKSSSSSGQQEDYADKAFAAGIKKSGYNIDRNTQEKITDFGREQFEKATGHVIHLTTKDIPDKYSN